ncbi:MAG: type II secretion system F family protein [Candidatus Aenigmarchaeota archaeon]|nr:type II secretion system F family protein [Candidatus Aenigmarchaeota archaeon]
MLKKISQRLFGDLIRPYADYFDPLKFSLKQARIKYTVEEYLSTLIFGSFIAFMISVMGMVVLITITTGSATYAYTLSLVISAVFSFVVFLMGYYYPNIRGKNIKTKIERSLPFTVVYMSTAASANITIADLFKTTSMRGGEIGMECRRIYRDIKMLGMDPVTAITKAANRTPSPMFAELLWGVLSVVERGGNLAAYLTEKSKEFMNHYRRMLNDYSKQVTFYTEIYVTLIIVGTLFFLVMTSIMSPMVGGNTLLLQTFLVFFFIPLISAGFIVLLRSIYPSD